MHKLLATLLLASTFVWAAPTADATDLCIVEFYSGQHPTSGDFQSFMVWGCSDDSYGAGYTSHDACYSTV